MAAGGVGEVGELTEVGVLVAVEELRIGPGPCSPFPLCFGGQGYIPARFLRQPLTERHRLAPGDACYGLIDVVGDITGRGVVLTVLVDIACVVLRVERAVLLVGHFGDAHPEGLCDLYQGAGGFVGVTGLAAHNERPCRDSHKLHHLAVWEFDFHFGLVALEGFGFCCIEWEARCLQAIGGGLLGLGRHYRFAGFGFSDRRHREAMFFFGVIGEPRVKRRQVEAPFFVFGVVPRSAMRGVQVDPRVEAAPRLVVEFDPVMPLLEYPDYRAGRGVPFHRVEHVHVALRAGPADEGYQGQIRLVLPP